MNREELYELVWSTPISKLCKTFGLSGVGLAKLCRRHEVPTPPRGYWAKLAAGQTMLKTPLPVGTESQGLRAQAHIQPREPQPVAPPDLASKEESHRAKSAGGRSVDDYAGRSHPLVAKTRRALVGPSRDKYGRVLPREAGGLTISVYKASIDRALRLINAVVRAMADLGHAVGVTAGDKPQVWFEILGERVVFRLDERVRTIHVPIVGEELERRIQWGYKVLTKPTYEPSGELTFLIDCWGAFRKTWSDGKKSLEDRLDAIIEGLVGAASWLRADRARKAEQERRRQEEALRAERQRVLDLQESVRERHLRHAIKAWRRSRSIRDFVAAARGVAPRDTADAPRIAAWLRWAEGYADSIDPLVTPDPQNQWPPPGGARRLVARNPSAAYAWARGEEWIDLCLPEDLPGPAAVADTPDDGEGRSPGRPTGENEQSRGRGSDNG